MIELTLTGRMPASLTRPVLERAVRLTFRRAKRSLRGSVAVAFVSNTEIRRLNRRWRRINRPTDVLSFGASGSPAHFTDYGSRITVHGSRFTVHGSRLPRHWGDIIISPSYVRTNAREQGVAVREEFVRVAVHGLLHLFGYDHATKKDEKRMFGIQERVVRSTVHGSRFTV